MGANLFGEFPVERTGTTSGPSSGTQPLLGQHEEGGRGNGKHDPAAARRGRRQPLVGRLELKWGAITPH